MKKFISLYTRMRWDHRLIIGAGLLALMPFGLGLLHTAEVPNEALIEASSLDTHIPPGFVLVPIEAENYEALDSILGHFGLVDLYQGDISKGGTQRLVARNVKLLRAPQNPKHFAVLVRETETSHVLGASGPFTVIVKRPSEGGTEFVKKPAVARRSISYDGG